ncbi:sugar phosphorylase [Carnobacterium gallinarum]|uniref:sugar phosphorylase n=1 Tax=Carnobacterium gallinarum TaxID=2749 RepID=UPI00054F8596|nr:sugar phosphorylase [Carnobacterium gallinarum]
MSPIEKAIKPKLIAVYGELNGEKALTALAQVIAKFEKVTFPKQTNISQKNVYLITYGDSIQRTGEAPLVTLDDTLNQVAKNLITDVHLLPMFPYTSDDGFSVVDYYQIDPDLGDWTMIEQLGKDYRLMFDFVANHMSKSSEWFQKFLEQDTEFETAFIKKSSDFDAENVVRPRTSPLFHEYQNSKGELLSAWTTFSEDQVDVNIRDVAMLARLTDVILTYALQGASSIRLDAIGFLWKESGTSSMHLTQTHELIKIWRLLLDYFAPHTQIITETNVPHEENISYFGVGEDEANMVYQFPLPPLVLHTFTQNSSLALSKWAKGIHRVSKSGTYFNFLASHDGIGMRPVEGLLTDEERQVLVEKVQENGGEISYKSNPDGSETVYELNINYSEALRNNGEEEQIAVQKMIAAHHILLSMVGVPAIYYHSLFGSKNDLDAVNKSGINRRINREKLDADQLIAELQTNAYRNQIFTGISELIQLRKEHASFSPYAEQEVLDFGEHVFVLKRTAEETGQVVLSFTNVTNETIELTELTGLELISNQTIQDKLTLAPYGVAWLEVTEV